jgi:hypothetical protein
MRSEAKPHGIFHLSGLIEMPFPFFGEAVFLQPAVGFVGQSWFNPAFFQGGEKISLPEVFAIRQPKHLLQLLPGMFTCNDSQKLSDLRGDLHFRMNRPMGRQACPKEIFGKVETLWTKKPGERFDQQDHDVDPRQMRNRLLRKWTIMTH